MKKVRAARPKKDTSGELEMAVHEALAWLKDSASPVVREGMARYGIPSDKALGVAVGAIQAFAKKLGRDAALSQALWGTDVYEARHLAVFVGDPASLSSAQMDGWCRDFDNWAICDAACFQLFDRSPFAFQKVAQWAGEEGEFQKRASFALLASLALHDRKAPDSAFRETFPLLEAASGDERNFVKKAVNWALRAIGSRNPALHADSLALAAGLAVSSDPSARWIGKDALRQLQTPATFRRLSPKKKPQG